MVMMGTIKPLKYQYLVARDLKVHSKRKKKAIQGKVSKGVLEIQEEPPEEEEQRRNEQVHILQ